MEKNKNKNHKTKKVYERKKDGRTDEQAKGGYTYNRTEIDTTTPLMNTINNNCMCTLIKKTSHAHVNKQHKIYCTTTIFCVVLLPTVRSYHAAVHFSLFLCPHPQLLAGGCVSSPRGSAGRPGAKRIADVYFSFENGVRAGPGRVGMANPGEGSSFLAAPCTRRTNIFFCWLIFSAYFTAPGSESSTY